MTIDPRAPDRGATIPISAMPANRVEASRRHRHGAGDQGRQERAVSVILQLLDTDGRSRLVPSAATADLT